NVDLIAVLASDDGFLSISAQKDFTSVEALKGHTVTVDAMTTGFAFVLREVVARKGVPESEVKFERAGGVANRFRAMLKNPSHAATTQMTPFELLAEARGFNTLVRARDVLEPLPRHRGRCEEVVGRLQSRPPRSFLARVCQRPQGHVRSKESADRRGYFGGQCRRYDATVGRQGLQRLCQ